jgi:hypothetical protein
MKEDTFQILYSTSIIVFKSMNFQYQLLKWEFCRYQFLESTLRKIWVRVKNRRGLMNKPFMGAVQGSNHHLQLEPFKIFFPFLLLSTPIWISHSTQKWHLATEMAPLISP